MEASTQMLMLIAVVVGLMAGAHGCTQFTAYMARLPAGNETDTQKVYYSKIVLYGKVVSKIEGEDDTWSDLDGVYTVKVDVLCIYKGGNIMKAKNGGEVPKTIYVTGAGNLNKQKAGCPKAPLEEGDVPLLYLKETEDGDVYEVEYKPAKDSADFLLDELSLNCNLQLITLDPVCEGYPPYDGPDCLVYTPPTRPPTTPGDKLIVKGVGDGYNTRTGEVSDKSGDDPNGSGNAVFASSLVLFIGTLLASLL